MQVVAVLLVLAFAGAVAQDVAERRDASAHPAPGQLVELPDGRRLHLQIAGAHHDGPTVVLEGGAGASVAAWGWVLPALAEHATVVTYDRAGLGWSDPGAGGPDPDTVVADLRAALAARGLPGPYVLVGHSLGSHYVRAFAAAQPGEVAGMVLVDPSHEDQAEVLGTGTEDMAPMFTAMRLAARVGLLRLYHPFETELHGLPEPQRSQALAQNRSVAYWRAFSAEMVGVDAAGAALPGGGALGDLPLRVLIAAGGASSAAEQQMVDTMAELRLELAGLSNRGEAVVLDEASHVSIVTDRDHAQAVNDAVLTVLAEAR